jgi:hypothetical protein
VYADLSQFPASRIHHAVRLEGIPVQMIKDFIQGIRGIIAVFQSLLPGEPVGGYVHIYIHHIPDFLLPAVGLGHGSLREEYKQQETSVFQHG